MVIGSCFLSFCDNFFEDVGPLINIVVLLLPFFSQQRMAPPKLDPWSSPSEWQRVYHLLYSPEQTLKREGLSFIKMWAARSQRLPLSVECTGELVAASLESGDTNAQISSYSLAIIRFVALARFLMICSGAIGMTKQGGLSVMCDQNFKTS